MEALRRDARISTPKPIPTVRGDRISRLTVNDHPATICVLFEELSPAASRRRRTSTSGSIGLGDITARIHLHGTTWKRPPLFQRPVLDWDAVLGANPLWGPWLRAPGLGVDSLPLFNHVADELKSKLQHYGHGPAGLV